MKLTDSDNFLLQYALEYWRQLCMIRYGLDPHARHDQYIYHETLRLAHFVP